MNNNIWTIDHNVWSMDNYIRTVDDFWSLMKDDIWSMDDSNVMFLFSFFDSGSLFFSFIFI